MHCDMKGNQKHISIRKLMQEPLQTNCKKVTFFLQHLRPPWKKEDKLEEESESEIELEIELELELELEQELDQKRQFQEPLEASVSTVPACKLAKVLSYLVEHRLPVVDRSGCKIIWGWSWKSDDALDRLVLMRVEKEVHNFSENKYLIVYNPLSHWVGS